MTSCFAYDSCFNAFVLFLVLNFVWRTIDDLSAFTVTRNAAKISFLHVFFFFFLFFIFYLNILVIVCPKST